MLTRRNCLAPAAAILSFVPVAIAAQQPGAAGSADAQISGVWRGTSECQVKDSACRDEANVYRISAAQEPGWFTVVGAKIIDGREIVMGTSDWHYEAGAHTLSTQGPYGTFRLTIAGKSMEGSLTLPDQTLFRRIHLEKEN